MSGDRAGLLRRLTEVEPDRPAPYPWLEGSDRTVADSVAWVNAEALTCPARINTPGAARDRFKRRACSAARLRQVVPCPNALTPSQASRHTTVTC